MTEPRVPFVDAAAQSHTTKVYSASDSLDAQLMASFLQDEGIIVHVLSDGGAVFGSSASANLYVTGADVQRAQQLISEFQARRIDHAKHAGLGSFQFGVRTALVNITIVAVLLAITRPATPEDRWILFLPIVFYLVIGNLMFMAYYRKQRSVITS